MSTHTICITSAIVHTINHLSYLRCRLRVTRHRTLLEVWDHGHSLAPERIALQTSNTQIVFPKRMFTRILRHLKQFAGEWHCD